MEYRATGANGTALGTFANASEAVAIIRENGGSGTIDAIMGGSVIASENVGETPAPSGWGAAIANTEEPLMTDREAWAFSPALDTRK